MTTLHSSGSDSQLVLVLAGLWMKLKRVERNKKIYK